MAFSIREKYKLTALLPPIIILLLNGTSYMGGNKINLPKSFGSRLSRD